MLNKIISKFNLSLLKTYSNQVENMLDKVMSIEGHISRDEAKQLMILAQHAPKNSVIVEIGSYRGRSTVALAFGALLGNQNRVYAVDPHIECCGVFGGEFGPKDQAKLYYNIIKHNVGDIVAVVSLSSIETAKNWSLKNVGLLFIDGDHKYESVAADYELWHQLMIDNNIIVFHDSDVYEVKQLTCELVKKRKIILLGELDSLSWFQSVGNK